jgi:outer membrane lipoprotein-sorting protein
VELTPKDGTPEIFYFDQKSAMLVRMTQTFSTAMGDIPVDVVFSDYRAVDGIQTPFSMVQKAMSQTVTMHFDKVAYNTDIGADRFRLPDAVKMIVEKRKQQ